MPKASHANVRFGFHKRTLRRIRAKSALRQQADISRRGYRRHMLASQGCLSGGKPAGR